MFTMGKNHKLHLLLLYLMVFRLEETHLRFILSQGKPLMGFCRTGILLYLLENTTEYFLKKYLFFITLLFIILTSIYFICSFITVKCYLHESPLVSMITFFVGEKQLAIYPLKIWIIVSAFQNMFQNV